MAARDHCLLLLTRARCAMLRTEGLKECEQRKRERAEMLLKGTPTSSRLYQVIKSAL